MSERTRRRLIAFLPLLALVLAGTVFALAVKFGAPKRPSALVGKPAPTLALGVLPDVSVPPLSSGDFKGGVTVVNFWASWCAPCRIEHPVLMALSKRGDITLAGIDWKDDPATAKAYLQHLGNPFARLGADGKGLAGIDWGISGVPETFVVGPDGRVLAHYEGPLTDEALRRLGIGD